MTLKEFEQKWLAAFATGIPKKQVEKHVTSRGNHIWHIFSWKLLPEGSYLTGDEAREAYNHLPRRQREQAVFIEPFGEKYPESFSLTWQESSAYHLDKRIEIFAVDEDFSWTYIKTHEKYCGPYFMKL